MVMTTDIWFQSELILEDIAKILGMTDINYDCENVWEWVIGNLRGVSMDITRDSTKKSGQTETVIFKLSGHEFAPVEYKKIIKKLHKQGITPVFLGRRVYLRGNDYEFYCRERFDIL